MARVLYYAFHADVSIIGLAVKLEGLIVNSAELMIATDFFLLAGQLQHDEVLRQHIGSQLGVVLVSAGGTVQELLLLVDHIETLLANGVSAV